MNYKSKKRAATNSTYPKVAVQWLNQALCFYQSLCLVDSEVLRNRHLRVAANRYRKSYQSGNTKDKTFKNQNIFIHLINKKYKMDIQTRKIEFVQAFLKLQSEEMISQFEKLLKKANKTNPDKEFIPFTIEELNERISKSEDDFKNGRYKTTSELLSKY